MSIAWAGESADPAHQMLHWSLYHLPGGAWTLLGFALVGGTIVLGYVFRKKVVDVLEFLMQLFGGRHP